MIQLTHRYRPVSDMAMFALKGCLAALWSGTLVAAYAAARHAGAPELVVDPILVGLAGLVSTLSGATALAWRINDLLLKEDARLAAEGGERRPFVRPLLFAFAHMGGSWMAGLLAFAMGRANDWDVWTLLAAVLLASFIGAKFVEAAAERWMAVVRLPGTRGEGAS